MNVGDYTLPVPDPTPEAPPPETLRPDRHLDADHPALVAYAQEIAGGLPPKEAAIALFYAVRDRIRYSPWRVGLRPEDYLASERYALPTTPRIAAVEDLGLPIVDVPSETLRRGTEWFGGQGGGLYAALDLKYLELI